MTNISYYAGSGIGRQLCIAYARAGCKAIALVDMDVNGIQETISLIKSYGVALPLLALEVDVTNIASVKNMVLETIKSFGRIDYGMFKTTHFVLAASRNKNKD